MSPAPNRFSRLSLAIVSSMLLISSVLFVAPSQAYGAVSTSAGADFVTAINDQRLQAGLPPLRVSALMTASAEAWTARMVQRSFIAHANLEEIHAATPAGRSKTGENVGRGQSVDSLLEAFMRSASHRSNILDPAFTHIGVGVEIHPSSGKLYTTHRFASVARAQGLSEPATPQASTSLPTVHESQDPPARQRGSRLMIASPPLDRGSRRIG